jgi:cobalt-zinc-cadmium efflux system membrane fusion protein
MLHHLLIPFSVVFLVACSESTPPEPNTNATTKEVSASTTPPKDKQDGIAIAAQSRDYLTIEAIHLKSTTTNVQAPARVEFREKALSSVGAIVAGRLNSIKTQVGEHVKAGTILATLESSEVAQMRSEVARTQAELSRAQDSVQRQNLMQKKGVGLEIERVEANTALKQAQAEYARSVQSSALLNGGTGQTVALRAPVDGVVLKVSATTGAAVAAGTVLFELGEPDALRIVADVFENDLHFIEAGDEVELIVPAVPQPVMGKVNAIGAAMDTDLRRVPVYISIEDSKVLSKLKAGMFAKATIKGEMSEQQVSLPSTAVLIKDAKQTIVYVEDATTGLFKARNVTAGPSRDGVVAIHEGLNDGDRVVTKGALLIDGEAQLLL